MTLITPVSRQADSQRPRFRDAIMAIEPQRIVEIARYASRVDDVILLCFGQADITSPEVANDAAVAALRRGETFYPDVRGLRPLRQALAAYTTRLHEVTIDEDRIAVTASGMAALNLALTAVTERGDNIVMLAPFWPNTKSVVNLLGAEPRPVPLHADPDGQWSLDLDRLFDAVDPQTRAIIINSPSNPTGWMARREELREIVEFARRRGLWVISDEVYERITYGIQSAPSVLEVSEEDDRVIVINSFSKTWAMTGWRLGWLTVPSGLLDSLAEAIECMTSGATSFAQFGALGAIEHGDPFIDRFRAYCARGRELVTAFLSDLDHVIFAPPAATFYAFFALEHVRDSLEFSKQLVRNHGVAVAPGTAFGTEYERWFRLCFAQNPDRLMVGLERLRAGLA